MVQKSKLSWLLGAVVLTACSPAPDDGGTLTLVEVSAGSLPEIAAPLFDQVRRYAIAVPQTGLQTDIYFPEVGQEATMNFPQVCLLQGANVDKDDYAAFAGRVAAYGFIVAVPDHAGLLGTLADLSTIAGTQAFVADASSDSASPLFGLLDDSATALLGHSFGGVAALDAVQDICRFPFCRGTYGRPANLAAVSVYGTNQCGPTGCETDAVDNDEIPVQMIQGSLDGLATAQETAETFERVASGPKQLVVVNGANHYGITDRNNPPGSNADDSSPTLTQDLAVETVARWTAMFLRAYLLQDPDALTFITNSGAAADQNVDADCVP